MNFDFQNFQDHFIFFFSKITHFVENVSVFAYFSKNDDEAKKYRKSKNVRFLDKNRSLGSALCNLYAEMSNSEVQSVSHKSASSTIFILFQILLLFYSFITNTTISVFLVKKRFYR